MLSSVAQAQSEVELSVLKEPTAAVVDGQNHFVYELVVENRTSKDLWLNELSANGGTLGNGQVSKADLEKRFKLLGTTNLETVQDWLAGPGPTPAVPRLVSAGRSALIYLQFEAALDVVPPSQIHHKLKMDWGSEDSAFEMDHAVNIKTEAPLVLSSPFKGGLWFPFNPPGDESAHRRSTQRFRGRHYIAQRFAIDWAKIGDDGFLIRPDSSPQQNASYYGHSETVHAVADATVVDITDDLPENVPGDDSRAVTINMHTVAGNSVILDLGGGHFALYAHLQPGTTLVKKGDRVTRGQPLALLGNSGNSTGPHLHFHVCDGPSNLECQGVPYVFESFTYQAQQIEGEDFVHLKFTPIGEAKSVTGELIRTNHGIRF